MELVPLDPIAQKILLIRGHRVILDSDLAKLYEAPIKRLNEQVRRNIKRFPPDFMFQLTPEEFDSLRSQNATLKIGRGQHRILAVKKKDPNADTSALERQIDEMVYKLYGLTEEEIEIVKKHSKE